MDIVLVLNVAWNILAPIFFIAATGFVGVRRLQMEARTLSTATFYILAPCLVFNSLLNLQLDVTAIGKIVMLHLTMIALLVGLGTALSWTQNWDRQLRSATILAIITQNTGNFGIPINRFAFGEEAIQITVLYYALTQITANTLGIFIVAKGATSSVRQAFKSLVRTPLIHAMWLALALRYFHLSLPAPLMRSIELCAAAAVPILLIILGMQLAQLQVEKDLKPLASAAGLRLLVSPLLAIVLTSLLGMESLVRQVSVIQWSVPTAVTAVVLASQYECRPAYVSGIIFTTTLASMATIPIVLMWLIP